MIFGTGAPKFIYNPTGLNEEVLLDYAIIIEDKPEADFLIHESIFTGHREFINLGKYWTIKLNINLYKQTYAETYFNTIKQYEGLEVRFFRHRDGDYVKDNLGAEVPFFLETIDESYYKTPDYKDLLTLKLKSTKYVDMLQGVI